MRLEIYLCLASALLLPHVAARISRQLAPRAAAVSLTGAACAAGAMWVTGIAVLAIATSARWPLVGEVGHWSRASLDKHDPVPLIAGWVSIAMLCIAFAGTAMAGSRLLRGLGQLRRLTAVTAGARCGDLAVIDADAPEALAIPGWPGSVLVTTGMLRALEPGEREVMLAHERSHLRNAHWVYRLLTRFGTALMPTGRPLIGLCDQALERWADEAAAEAVGDRDLTAASVAKAALATTAHHRTWMSPAFAEGAVTARVEALLEPAPLSRFRVASLPLSVAVLGMATLLAAGRDLDRILDLAKHL